MKAASEFRRGWPVVLAAAAGCGLGVSGLFTYNAGLFVPDLAKAIGLTRTQFGIAFFLPTLAMAFAVPLVGRIVDRRGAAAPALAGAVGLALAFLALGLLTSSVATYMLLTFLVGGLGAASAPVPFSRAVSAAFDRSRGLALGFMQMGIGVAAAVFPPLVAAVIGGSGWRSGYFLLAGLALLGVVPALALTRAPVARLSGAELPGLDFATAIRRRTFWIQLSAFVVMAFAFAGLLPHFVPMLRDAGMSPAKAGALAGAIGLSVIVSRVIVGWLVDRVPAALVAAGACIVCGVGCLVLAWAGPGMALVAAIALGATMGAEADLVSFLTARNFGLAAYGRAYGWQYAAFIVASGVSPIWVGAVADRTGSYQPALVACALLLVVAVGLFVYLHKAASDDGISTLPRT
ncbi:MAG: MFS transporter [Caulobacteraceae bacterium]